MQSYKDVRTAVSSLYLAFDPLLISYEVGMYIAARLILGFGIPTCIVSGSSLIGELGYPKERPILTSLFNVSYFVGEFVLAVPMRPCLQPSSLLTEGS